MVLKKSGILTKCDNREFKY